MNIKMPEPVGYLVTFENGETEFHDEHTSLGESQEKLYTADALRKVLEQAARISENHFHSTTAKQIRALKDSIK